MGEKQCGKCGEMVDDAKAFCPACGNTFVEERERTTKTDFDLSAHTVRLGDSMYNRMLADMGLSISKEPNREGANVASPVPAASEAPVPPSGVVPSSAQKPPILKWVLIGIAALFVFLALLVVLAAVAIILYSR